MAALAVLFYHGYSDLTAGTVNAVLRPFFGGGRLGVSFFFMLSGFVLVWSSRPDDSPRQFYRRRFARIYPVYLLTLIAAAVVVNASLGRVPTTGMGASLFLLQSWVPRPSVFYSVNPVAWSLSCEAFFYVVFPFALSRLRKLNAVQRRHLLYVLFGLVILVNAVGVIVDHDQQVATGQGLAVWFVYVFPPTRFLEFAIGMVLATRMRIDTWQPKIPFPLALALAGAGYMLAAIRPDSLGWEAVTVLPLAYVIAAGAARDINERGTVFRRRAWVWLGAISYCVYLSHFTIVRWWEHHQSLQVGATAILEVGVVAAVGLVSGTILHYLVEKPCDRLLRGDGRVSVVLASDAA